MKTRTLTKSKLAAEPYQVWNAYVDLLANEDYYDLTSEQRPAHLVFWYESEIQNGGHLQYFENHGTEHLAETIAALGLLGAESQQRVLIKAGERWASQERQSIETSANYFETALEGEFDDFDSGFHDCSPSLQVCLESHLAAHQSVFVTII